MADKLPNVHVGEANKLASFLSYYVWIFKVRIASHRE
jgi:hypothetical protein